MRIQGLGFGVQYIGDIGPNNGESNGKESGA